MALKKLTTAESRGFAFGVQYAVFNFAFPPPRRTEHHMASMAGLPALYPSVAVRSARRPLGGFAPEQRVLAAWLWPAPRGIGGTCEIMRDGPVRLRA